MASKVRGALDLTVSGKTYEIVPAFRLVDSIESNIGFDGEKNFAINEIYARIFSRGQVQIGPLTESVYLMVKSTGEKLDFDEIGDYIFSLKKDMEAYIDFLNSVGSIFTMLCTGGEVVEDSEEDAAEGGDSEGEKK